MTKKYIPAIALLICAALSFFLAGPIRSVVTDGAGISGYLDDKQMEVLKIAGAAAGASAVISAIPDDAGTPIAEKFADISMYTIIVLCAVFLEKYLVRIGCSLAFQILIPAACILGAVNLAVLRRKSLTMLSVRLAAIALVAAVVVPCSVVTSRFIEDAQKEKIAETIQETNDAAQEIEENSTDQTLWEKFTGTITNGVRGLINGFEDKLVSFVEIMAVMLVTSCIIPLVVMLFMWWLVKSLIQSLGFRPPHKLQNE
ncbi:MAG: hypothetical protein IKD69_01350 [Solobacterium sp.]|nr:hypothetical protein [Solobacterium sp.]